MVVLIGWNEWMNERINNEADKVEKVVNFEKKCFLPLIAIIILLTFTCCFEIKF